MNCRRWVNGDGLLDWFVTSIYEFDTIYWTGNKLYINDHDKNPRTFNEVSESASLFDGGWGWASSNLDYDNDGDQDIVHTNGYLLEGDYAEDRTRLFQNNGFGSFTEVGLLSGILDFAHGKGLLTLDFDRDGDQDIFVINHAGHPVLYRNDIGNQNNWLRIKTVGAQSNRDGIGAFITVIPNLDSPLDFMVHEIDGGSNFLTQNEMTAHFGLGPQTEPVDRVTIRWPSGMEQVYKDLPVNSRLVLLEGDPFVGQPIAGFPNWWASTWYGDYNVEYWPWIYHSEHGWQYVIAGSDPDTIFLWDVGLEAWIFVNESNYRWIYLYGQKDGWVWTFEDNTPQLRYLQRLDDGSLIMLPSDV